jgi:hypothetical protein
VEVVPVVVQMALSIVLTVALQVAVRRRLPEDRLARGWNGATWGAAVYAFGPLSMLGFFWVLRRPGRDGAAIALAAGVGSAAGLLGALALAGAALDAMIGPSSWRGGVG